MRTFAACVVSSLMLGSLSLVACKGAGDATSTASTNEATKASAAEWRDNDNRKPDPSSPFIAGEWKFIPGDAGPDGPQVVDTEFRFVNPTNDTVNLEYAFFEPDGGFCGCDRDTLNPNKTTIYTVNGEQQTAAPNPSSPIPTQFACSATSGALKAFVFKNRGQRIFLDDTTQVGFQTHAFGNVLETPDGVGNFNFIQGNVMTEATMAGVTISDSTRDDIKTIHTECVQVQGNLTMDLP